MSSQGSIVLLLAGPLLAIACAGGSKLQAYRVPTHTLRVAQVVAFATEQEIKEAGAHEVLLNSGIATSEIVDGSLAASRVYCCGGPNETGMGVFFYVPPALELEAGDIVEVRMGRPGKGSDPGTANIALKVRDHAANPSGECWWDPPDEALWMRVIYCDWMESEGWTYQSGLFRTWMKTP